MELHAIEYEGIPIEYELIRKDVKYINLRVNKHGQVVVSAAKRVPFSVIEEFVQSKALWIINHLAEVEKIRMTQPTSAMYDGKTLYYLGKPYTLHIVQGLRQIQRSDNIIHMSTFQTDSVGLRSEYLDWLREQAVGTFSRLLDEIYPKVKDYGIGIDADKIEYIFDRFYRADESRAQNNNNFGLGLAIAKRVCSSYGYSLEVASTINEYTEFTITFIRSSE